MEINTSEVLLGKSLFAADIDKEIEKEFALPDYCPDVERIIRVDANPYIESASCAGGRCTVEGKMIFSVLYESDLKNRLSFATFSADISEKTDIPDQTRGECRASASAAVKRIGCRLLSPRKLLVRARSVLSVAVKSETPVSIIDASALPENVFALPAKCEYDRLTDPFVREYRFSEAVTMNENTPPVEEAVMTCVNLHRPEYSQSDDGVTVKTTAHYRLLYADPDGEYRMFSHDFPITMLVEDMVLPDGATLDITATVTEAETSTDIDPYGENRVLNAAFTVMLHGVRHDRVICDCASDAFISGCENTLEKQTMATLAAGEKYARVFPEERTFPAAEPEFKEIIDCSARVTESDLETGEDGLYLTGSYVATVLGRTEQGWDSADYNGSFREKLTSETPVYDTRNIDICAFECSATVLPDGSTAVRIMFAAAVTLYSEKKFEAVTRLTGEKPATSQEAALTLIYCYPAAGDTLWSIAKKYCVSPDGLRTDNPSSFADDGTASTGRPVLVKK